MTNETCNVSQNHYQPPPTFSESELEETRVSADQTQVLNRGSSKFIGNVVIEQHLLRLRADSAEYDRRAENVTLKGNIHADLENLSLDADSGFISLKESDSSFDSALFYFLDSSLRGETGTLKSSGKTSSHLTDATITSCPPDKIDWSLRASRIDIDHIDEYGSAEDAVLTFMDVPFFYFPYLEFPVGEKRRSGFLAPEIGNSGSRGFELALPWYWNIAPNQDATLTPRYMHRRGLGLDAEYRYLTEKNTGELSGSYLADDDQTNDERYFIHFEQETNFNHRAKLKINVSDISDTSYNDDFGNIITDSTQVYLDREARFTYNSDDWQASILTHSTKNLNVTPSQANRPYSRVPQLTASGELPIGDSGISTYVKSEAVRFDHVSNTRNTGSRLMITPGVSYPLSGVAWFLKPSFEINHTRYDVEDGAGNTVIIEDRTIPVTSVDAGLFFERTTADKLLQTLEPRIYYLNIPYEDQSNNTIFDSSLYGFNHNQLFRNNRFSGNDLIGDANQLSLSLSSRLYNPISGNELFSATIGQIFYFSDRNVTLPTGTVETTDTSDIITEMSSTLDKLRLHASVQWDTEKKRSSNENFSINYKSEQNKLFNISYRMTQNQNTKITDTRHVDTSFIAPLTQDINFISRWDYSLKDDRHISVLGGISYESCCWSLSVVAQRNLLTDTGNTEDYDRSVMVQLLFKEFGSVSGDGIKNTLSDVIPGYTEEY